MYNDVVTDRRGEKNMSFLKRTIAVMSAGIMLAVSVPFAVSADNSLNVKMRIEGDEKNLFFDTVSVKSEKSDITVADALVTLDKQNDTIEITGADTGYITAVNGIAGGKYGGWDGWYYSVNGETPMVGIGDFNLKEGDSVVLYFGGYPCQIPFADTDKLSEGVIAFKSNDMVYDDKGNAAPEINPVTDANVTVNGDSYTTDEKGEITIPEDKLVSQLAVQIDKKDASGAPAVLRFEPDFVIEYTAPTTDSDSAADTDSASDTEVNTETDTATDAATDTATDTASNVSSHISNSDTKSDPTQAFIKHEQQLYKGEPQYYTGQDSAQTGDGRIYLACGVLAAAVIVAVIMILTKKKSDD